MRILQRQHIIWSQSAVMRLKHLLLAAVCKIYTSSIWLHGNPPPSHLIHEEKSPICKENLHTGLQCSICATVESSTTPVDLKSCTKLDVKVISNYFDLA